MMAQLGDQQRREECEEDEEGGRYRPGADLRGRDAHGHQILDGPRLASDLGQHPAGLRSEVGQRDRPYGDPQQPAPVRQFILAVEPPDDAQQQDEEAPGTDLTRNE